VSHRAASACGPAAAEFELVNRPIRILYLEPSALVTGGATALLRLISALDRKVFSPLVVLGSAGPLVSEFRGIPGCRVLCRPLPSGLATTTRFNMMSGVAANAASILHYAAALKAIANRWRPDVVHSNGLKTHFLSALARPRGALLIWHMRDFVSMPYMPDRNAVLVRMLARRVPDVIVCNSETTKASLVDGPGGGVTPRAIHIVPDGIDSPPGRKPIGDSLDSRPLCILLLGRIADWKGQHVFVEAVRLLSRLHASVRFVIAGGATTSADLAYEQWVRSIVDAYGLGDRLTFAGVVRDVGALFDEADILVHCSTSPEPFGQVIIEAMAASVPVVATRLGAPASIVEDGVSGRLVPPGDPVALARTLDTLLNDAEMRRRFAEAALARVRERYGIERTVQALADLYRPRTVPDQYACEVSS
jgi:glycosyltransferase involved in cell wall biosynthesis